MQRRFQLILLAAPFLLGGCVRIESRDPQADAAEEVRAVDEAYVSGWRANDAAAVMATLADDAILLPPGVVPVQGAAAIRDYWWPPGGPTTTITEYENSIDELDVSDDLAFVRGTADLTLEWASADGIQQQSGRSAYLMVLRRHSDGAWKITHRMWGRVPR
jgi:ketosteroid isomerase-like protein